MYNTFDEAFVRYQAAKNLHYYDIEIDQIISNRKEDAIIKYADLAKLEANEGHLDIAMAHLAKANALESSNQLVSQFVRIISTSKVNDLRSASEKLKIEFELVPVLLNLIEAAEQQDPGNSKIELIKSTIST